MGVRGEVFSSKVILANRTYFFNVKENRMGDLYLNIVESKNRDNGGFDRQSVILFADDLQEFLKGFDESLKVMEKAVREKRRGGGDSSKRGEKTERNDEYGFDRGSKDSGGKREFDRKPKSRDSGRGFDREAKSHDSKRGFDRGSKDSGGEYGFKRGPKSRDGERGFDRGAKSRSGERGFKGGFKSGGERGFDRGTKSRESGHGANRSRPGRSGPERGKPDRGSKGGKRVVVKKTSRRTPSNYNDE